MGAMSRLLVQLISGPTCGFLGDKKRAGVFGDNLLGYIKRMRRIDDVIDEKTDEEEPMAEDDAKGRIKRLRREAYKILESESFSEKWKGDVSKLTGRFCDDYEQLYTGKTKDPYKVLGLKTNSFTELLITASVAKAFPERDHKQPRLEVLLEVSTKMCEFAQIIDDFTDIENDRHMPYQNVFLCCDGSSLPGEVFKMLYAGVKEDVDNLLTKLKMSHQFVYYFTCRALGYMTNLLMRSKISEKINPLGMLIDSP